MRTLNIASLALIASALAIASAPVQAATAHNSQAGSYGMSANPGASTVGSPRVKHSAKHKGMRR